MFDKNIKNIMSVTILQLKEELQVSHCYYKK